MRTLARWTAGMVALAIGAAADAGAQERHGPRPALTRAHESALARSAAPAQVSDSATVWVWADTAYVIAERGTGRVNCYVVRLWTTAIEPHCLDEEGSATILPMQMRRMQLYAQGRSTAEVEREIADGLASGHFRLPQRPAITYMMSAAQQLVTQEGNAVGAWQPHLMIYYPYLSAESTGLPGFVPDLGFVENPGTAFAALIVPLKTFVPAPKQ
jgi:hypothetical protein